MAKDNSDRVGILGAISDWLKLLGLIVLAAEAFLTVVVVRTATADPYAIWGIGLLSLIVIGLFYDRYLQSQSASGIRSSKLEPESVVGIQLGNLSAAATKLKEILALGRRHHSLRIIAVTGRSHFKYYLADLIKDYEGELELELQVINPSSKFGHFFPSHWAEEARSTVQEIVGLFQGRDLPGSIELWQYEHVPCIVGDMINDEHLIMALFGFESSTGKLEDYKQHYSYYARSPENERLFELFEGWLNYAPKATWEDHTQQK